MRLYLDSSAIVKLVQRETESEALRWYLRRHRGDDLATSALARAKVVRAVLPAGTEAVAHARRRLARLHQINLDVELLDRAATVVPGSLLRTLDAVHVVSAQLLDSDLRAVVTYDRRLSDAAEAAGLPVDAPA